MFGTRAYSRLCKALISLIRSLWHDVNIHCVADSKSHVAKLIIAVAAALYSMLTTHDRQALIVRISSLVYLLGLYQRLSRQNTVLLKAIQIQFIRFGVPVQEYVLSDFVDSS
ncbi:MAG: hypothetical protein EZS28_013804 [Streblomastix strix]|uniref:Uncharacterized protein n=1 Tax=Streblomastix strix TaxID=222440 RepID=A0A5J4W7A6_9EUKA|nr:MAG: hypothetical protein EZS28_013804 [Streblomastix strix]